MVPHYVEAIASFALVAAIIYQVRFPRQLLARKADLERSLITVNTAFHKVITGEFDA